MNARQEWLDRRGPISDDARRCRWCSTGTGDPVDDCGCARDQPCGWRGCGSQLLKLQAEGGDAAVMQEMLRECEEILAARGPAVAAQVVARMVEQAQRRAADFGWLDHHPGGDRGVG